MSNFAFEICQYIDQQDSSFAFTSSNSNLKVGELVRGVQGVFAVSSPSRQPDMYTPIRYYAVDFWAKYQNSDDAYENLRKIYNLFHQAHDYQTSNHYIYFSHAAGEAIDLDRDGEGSKLLKLSVIFISRMLIS